MATSSSYVSNARKKIEKYLIEQAGYSKKSATMFYKQGDDILTRVYIQRSRGITQLHVGIAPLYVPNEVECLYGIDLATTLPGSTIIEDASEYQANAWAERIICYLESEILKFMESLSSPKPLLKFLLKRYGTMRRFIMSPFATDKLIIFSLAYMGKVSFAVKYAKKAQRKIKKERIDSLASTVVEYDKKIAYLREELTKSKCGKDKKYYEEQIRSYEIQKQLAVSNAEDHAPGVMEYYDQWIEPLIAPGFQHDTYFSKVIADNKKTLNYEKLFFPKGQKKA